MLFVSSLDSLAIHTIQKRKLRERGAKNARVCWQRTKLSFLMLCEWQTLGLNGNRTRMASQTLRRMFAPGIDRADRNRKQSRELAYGIATKPEPFTISRVCAALRMHLPLIVASFAQSLPENAQTNLQQSLKGRKHGRASDSVGSLPACPGDCLCPSPFMG